MAQGNGRPYAPRWRSTASSLRMHDPRPPFDVNTGEVVYSGDPTVVEKGILVTLTY